MLIGYGAKVILILLLLLIILYTHKYSILIATQQKEYKKAYKKNTKYTLPGSIAID